MKATGLSSTEAIKLQQQFGVNELPTQQQTTVIKLFFGQFTNLLVILLVFATVVAFVVGDLIDGFLILTVILLNTLLGFFQEYKASRELAALRQIESTTSRVIRDGQEQELPSKELVPGDLVMLESGANVPADGNLVTAYNFTVNQSALTGEALPVPKTIDPQESMLFFGTSVTTGRGHLLVTAIGKSTKFGQLAITLAALRDETTPLEKSLHTLAKTVTLIAVALSALLFFVNQSQQLPVFDSLISSIALIIALVPEGLPAVVTVSLAFGVRSLYKHRTVVRRLSAVESLGAATVICTDKTGTLTENKLSVTTHFPQSALQRLTEAAVLCNSASLVITEPNQYKILGDTMEGALLSWASRRGQDIDQIRTNYPLIEELPFDAVTRSMTVLTKHSSHVNLTIKGAPEVILPRTTLTPDQQANILRQFHEYANMGLRVLAFAGASLPKDTTSIPTNHPLEFYGLVALADTVRPSVASSISKARAAGIRTIMLTGDNELTARYVAIQVGILESGQGVMLGDLLSRLTDAELDQQISQISVFARITPDQKLRIVQSLQRLGETVAVTGDGVNDALALKQAAVGVAMGITGTDVAKEAADIVILDDNYSTLITAIEQGRVIYQNLYKITKFLLIGSLSKGLLIIFAVIFGLPVPLLPVQLLWANFATDGLPALALTVDSPSKKVMTSKPRQSNQQLLDWRTLRYIGICGSGIALIIILVYYVSLSHGLLFARIVAFNLIVFSQLIFVFLMRRHHSILSNKYLLGSVLTVIVAQLAITTLEPLRIIFKLATP